MPATTPLRFTYKHLTTHGPVCGLKYSSSGITVNHSSSIGRQIAYFFKNVFDTDDFPARWHCGNWTDFHGWLYIFSDLTIWAAYFAIPVMLLRIMIKRKDIPISGMILLFLAFVSLCGLTHLIDAVIFWWPLYRLSAILRFATAIVSVIAAYALNKVFPMLLGLRSVKDMKTEIARRKKTEARLSASEFLLSEAGRIAGVGGWEIDLINDKRIYSKTVYNVLEMPDGHDIYGEHPLSYYHEPYRTMLQQAVKYAMENAQKWDLEVQATTLQNNKLWVRHIGEPVRNLQGKIVRLRGVVMNIDQYKKHELELSRALKVSQDQKQQLKNFAYVLSHQIRNHTSNLAGLSAMTDADKLDEENREVFLKTRQVTQSLVATLDDLAVVIDAQDRANEHEPIAFMNLANIALNNQAIQILSSGAQILQEFAVPEITFSRLCVNNIFQHLLSNAIRYRDPERKLQILFKSYKNDNGQLVLACTDNGLGIDLERFGMKIFGLYATFHPGLSGRGVGLYLIKTQIESLGGKILITSTPGKGSTVQVVFPFV